MAGERIPSMAELKEAHQRFLENEPRDLFYRVATELIKLALKGLTTLSLSEAVAVLLQTWNRAYYQYYRFDAKHFSDIDRLLDRYQDEIVNRFRNRSPSQLSQNEKTQIEVLFADFEKVLGPTGAAKTLHLLAPRFFPLWDHDIAKAHSCTFQKRGKNGSKYRVFVEMVHNQYEQLKAFYPEGVNLLKLLDEYNYCKYTKKWL